MSNNEILVFFTIHKKETSHYMQLKYIFFDNLNY